MRTLSGARRNNCGPRVVSIQCARKIAGTAKAAHRISDRDVSRAFIGCPESMYVRVRRKFPVGSKETPQRAIRQSHCVKSLTPANGERGTLDDCPIEFRVS